MTTIFFSQLQSQQAAAVGAALLNAHQRTYNDATLIVREQLHGYSSAAPASSSFGNDAPSAACFRKGACIDFSNGLKRRVEDIRTEDFIKSASLSPYFQLTESTVVKIERMPNDIVQIVFNYDRSLDKVELNVPLAQPLFVYGQGWASCNPRLSLQIYGLKCQQLQVGDICLTLTEF